MVSLEDSHFNSSHLRSVYGPHSQSAPSLPKIGREKCRSMRMIRSTLYSNDDKCCNVANSAAEESEFVSENLTDSVVDLCLRELPSCTSMSVRPELADDSFLDVSQSSSDFSFCSSDISGELQRLATLRVEENILKSENSVSETELEPCLGFLQHESFSTEITGSISSEDLQPKVKICIDGLQSPSVTVKRSAAAKLRLLAKNRSEYRALIAESGGVPALIPLLHCSDPSAQEHAVTALLNLSLYHDNKILITNAGAIKSIIYVLKTGTVTSKQNAAASLMSLAMIDDNKLSIGACGAIPPLVSLLMNGSNRGKKDALATLYKLCSARLNKERTVVAGAVKPLVALVLEQGAGMAEKAMVVLCSLGAIPEGRSAIVEEGGIPALVEAVEYSSEKGKEFAVMTLLQLCADSVRNRGLLVREGGIPPLVALSQTGTARSKHKAKKLLGYLRESRQ
ncbi:hypothetical protein Nepgr_021288 [Nepenthes gracilis]|uniref:RING-type E3 ubiquitin transferase n=1 Tax=Nepenthes gracilis TaxID=150966 RepID=A0AAD3SYJ8_NEPGR|nr:hypothetical protein Nepgr_021288 [Nepenthes gracilis]